jgi:hypothetical protein
VALLGRYLHARIGRVGSLSRESTSPTRVAVVRFARALRFARPRTKARWYVEAEGASGALTAKDFKLERTRGGARC